MNVKISGQDGKTFFESCPYNNAPEGPARDMAMDLEQAIETLAYAVECTLATIDSLEAKARPSKAELRRQHLIADELFNNFMYFYMQWDLELSATSGCPRLRKKIADRANG